MSPTKRPQLSLFTVLLAMLALSALAQGISSVRSLPAGHTITDFVFTLLISGEIPLIVFLFIGLVIRMSRFLRRREPLAIKTVRQHLETHFPFVVVRRIKIIGDPNGNQILVLVQHGLAPPLYSVYEVDGETQAVTLRQDSTLLPPDTQLMA